MREEDAPREPFSSEALASWAHICHEEVLCALRRPDSWLYAFEQRAAGRAPDGHALELAAQRQSPPLQVFATRAQPAHSLARASLPTPLAAVARALTGVASTRRQREVFAHLHGSNFLDARVLQVGARTADPFHFVGVKYLCLKAGRASKPRAHVFLEHSGSATDARGDLVVFYAVRTMPEEALSLSRYAWSNPAAVRGNMSMTILLRASHAGARTEVTAQGMHDVTAGRVWGSGLRFAQPLGDSLARLATLGAAQTLQRQLREAARMAPLLHNVTKRGAPGSSASASSSASSSPSSSASSPRRAVGCRVCLRGRRLLPSTRVCAGCDRQVCKACTLQLHFLSGQDGETLALRFCLDCVADARACAGRGSCSDAAQAAAASVRSRQHSLRPTRSAAALASMVGV